MINNTKTHQAILFRFSKYRQRTFNNQTYLLYIARPPENNTLNCGYLLCNPCMVILGHIFSEKSWNYILPTCPLYKAPNKVRFLLKPYTTRIRALSISK
jgi:hypothetical protein